MTVYSNINLTAWMEPAWDDWKADYSKPLGRPLGPANITDNIATRLFATGTVAAVNLTDLAAGGLSGGCVKWSDGTQTGWPHVCDTLLPLY